MHVPVDLRRGLRPGRPGLFCIIAILGYISASKADIHPPVIGDVYNNIYAGSTGVLTQPAASGKDTVSIQSATAATPGPICKGDSQCQALCPAVDFTKAQPALTAAAVQQQVRPFRRFANQDDK